MWRGVLRLLLLGDFNLGVVGGVVDDQAFVPYLAAGTCKWRFACAQICRIVLQGMFVDLVAQFRRQCVKW